MSRWLSPREARRPESLLQSRSGRSQARAEWSRAEGGPTGQAKRRYKMPLQREREPAVVRHHALYEGATEALGPGFIHSGPHCDSLVTGSAGTWKQAHGSGSSHVVSRAESIRRFGNEAEEEGLAAAEMSHLLVPRCTGCHLPAQEKPPLPGVPPAPDGLTASQDFSSSVPRRPLPAVCT